MHHLAAFAVFAALTAAAAVTGSQFMPGPWYAALAKPAWTPPNWVFGPVWTVLYVMIAVAGYLAWRAAGRIDRAVAIWGASVVLNGAWSWLFFGQRLIGAALVDIVLLWLAIAAFIAATWRTARAAAWLFVPYLAWVGYASALNAAIWLMNR